MPVTFIHTADWQLGKPYGSVVDVAKRSRLQQERFDVIDRIGTLVTDCNAAFVVVAGDLFDSPSPSKSIVSAACGGIGSLAVPVFVIPGNHDHGGPLGLWEQPFFQSERASLAPNLRILLSCEPVDLDDAVLLPCPLMRRHESSDLTAWLRSIEEDLAPFGKKARIAIAHGSVQSFAAPVDEEEGGGAPNQIDLDRLDDSSFDYIALGDWHGMKQVGSKAWYSGTPELDRFRRGEEYAGRHVLVVQAGRGAAPFVHPVNTSRLGWHAIDHQFTSDDGLDQLDQHLNDLLGTRVGKDLVHLTLSGSLGMAAMKRLDGMLEALDARLLRVKAYNAVTVAPSETEIVAMTARSQDPLISRVASILMDRLDDTTDTELVRAALRELYAAVV